MESRPLKHVPKFGQNGARFFRNFCEVWPRCVTGAVFWGGWNDLRESCRVGSTEARGWLKFFAGCTNFFEGIRVIRKMARGFDGGELVAAVFLSGRTHLMQLSS